MFFKIRSNILFRNYIDYGYITDNSLYGYNFSNDSSTKIGEKYVSKTGTIFLSMLNKKPQNLSDIVNKLSEIFVNVNKDELINDALVFFRQLENEGYLCSGVTFEECEKNDFVYSGSIDNLFSEYSEENQENIPSQNNIIRGIHIEITTICNERCVHCYIPHKDKTKTMESNLFYRIIEEGRNLNILNVTLSGGEPLCHRDLCNFLKKCRELDLSVNILTNLTLLDDDMIEEFVKNPLISIQTSLYSVNPAIHDAVTNLSGSCDRTKNAIKKLVSLGIPVQVACPILKENKDTYVDVVKWGKEINVPVLLDYVIFSDYNHTGKNITHRLSESDIEKILDERFSNDIDFLITVKEKAKEREKLKCSSPVCSVCSCDFCVSVEGDIYPCSGWQKYKLGSLKNSTIFDIWNNSLTDSLREITMEKFPICMQCKDRNYCTICMMKNYNETQKEDMFAPNKANCVFSAILHRKAEMYLINNK